MLYDPKWEVKTDPMSLTILIAWLEMQQADAKYCYEDNGACLLSRYFTAHGIKNICMYTDGFIHGPKPVVNVGLPKAVHDPSFTRIPQVFNQIAIGGPRTFGAALARARHFVAAS